MKIMLAIILASSFLAVTMSSALNCYQCVDASVDTGSSEMNAAMLAGLPRCDSSNTVACDPAMDHCTNTIVRYRMMMGEISATTYTVARGCGVSTELMDKGDVCQSVEQTLDSSAVYEIEDFTCRVQTCTTDNCNDYDMEVFESGSSDRENGDSTDRENGDSDRYDEREFTASGTGLPISCLLFTAVAMFLA